MIIFQQSNEVNGFSSDCHTYCWLSENVRLASKEGFILSIAEFSSCRFFEAIYESSVEKHHQSTWKT